MQSFPVVCCVACLVLGTGLRAGRALCAGAPTARWSSACRCAPATRPRASWRRCARRGAAIRPTSTWRWRWPWPTSIRPVPRAIRATSSYAQSTLQRWWSLPEPPAAVRTVRAIVLQYDHRFDDALADLAAAVRADPDDAVGLVLVHRDPPGARRSRWRAPVVPAAGRAGARAGGRCVPRADRCVDRSRGTRRRVAARGAAARTTTPILRCACGR